MEAVEGDDEENDSGADSVDLFSADQADPDWYGSGDLPGDWCGTGLEEDSVLADDQGPE